MADRTFARLRADLHSARKPAKVIHRTPVVEPPPVAPAPVQVPKAAAAPPKGKGGPIWQKLLADAVAQGHPEPERLADTLLRAREKTLELKEKRHKVEITTKKPTPAECAGAAAGAKKVTGGALCKAVTLENRPCKFRAVCGEFCKKHSSGK
jgi:hypothetical protein